MTDGELSRGARCSSAPDAFEEIQSWCTANGFPAGTEIDERHLYCYLVSLRLRGNGVQALRRVVDTLIDRVPASTGSPGARWLPDRANRTTPDAAMVLVVAEDPVFGVGLENLLIEHGQACIAVTPAMAQRFAAAIWDYVIIWPLAPGRSDRYASVSCISDLVASMPQVTAASVRWDRSHPLRALREAEAGIQFQIDYETFATDTAGFVAELRGGAIRGSFQLATPLALRQEQGLRLTGDVAQFLAIASALPAEVWTTNRTQRALGIPRSAITGIRRAAWEVAGIPAPDYARFSSSMRAAPEYPEWSTVRNFVRICWGLDDHYT